jgi:hypothetical protein
MPRRARPPWERGRKVPAPRAREARARVGVVAPAPRVLVEPVGPVRVGVVVRARPVRVGVVVRVLVVPVGPVGPVRVGVVVRAPRVLVVPVLAAQVLAAREPVLDLRPLGSVRLPVPARAPAPRSGCPLPRVHLLSGPRVLGPRANPPIHPERDPARVAEPNCPPQSPDSVSPAAWRVYSGHRKREAS